LEAYSLLPKGDILLRGLFLPDKKINLYCFSAIRLISGSGKRWGE